MAKDDDDDDTGFSSGFIILIVVIVLFFIILIILAFVFFFRTPTNTTNPINNGTGTGKQGPPGPAGPPGPPGDCTGNCSRSITQSYNVTLPSSGTVEIPLNLGLGQIFNVNYIASISIPSTLLGGNPTVWPSSGPSSSNEVAFDTENINGILVLHVYKAPVNLQAVLTVTVFYEPVYPGGTETLRTSTLGLNQGTWGSNTNYVRGGAFGVEDLSGSRPVGRSTYRRSNRRY